MDRTQFDAWTRRHVGLATGGLAVFIISAIAPGGLNAKKQGNRKKRNRKERRRDRHDPSACARTCGSVCNFCVTRAAASLVCGEGTLTACDRTCSSDFDCLGSGFRYCITTIEEVRTGRVAPACEDSGGHCANIAACEV